MINKFKISGNLLDCHETEKYYMITLGRTDSDITYNIYTKKNKNTVGITNNQLIGTKVLAVGYIKSTNGIITLIANKLCYGKKNDEKMKKEKTFFTPLGEITLTPSDNQEGGFYATLLDSDKEFVANLYWQEEGIIRNTNKLMSMKDINDFVKVFQEVVCMNLVYSATKHPYEDIQYELNSYDKDTLDDGELWTIDGVRQFTNRIGNIYFIVDYTEL